MSSKHDCKKFWQFVNKRSDNMLPYKMRLDDEIVTDDRGKSRLFAKLLSSVYVEHGPDNGLDDFIANRNQSNTNKIVPTRESILYYVLSSMDTNKGIGMDMDIVSPIFLRNCAELLSTPLHIIFSKSLESGVYPSKWKIGCTTPSTVSDHFDVPSSVGQGSILCPLLFLLFFYDSDKDIGESFVFKFAEERKNCERDKQ